MVDLLPSYPSGDFAGTRALQLAAPGTSPPLRASSEAQTPLRARESLSECGSGGKVWPLLGELALVGLPQAPTHRRERLCVVVEPGFAGRDYAGEFDEHFTVAVLFNQSEVFALPGSTSAPPPLFLYWGRGERQRESDRIGDDVIITVLAVNQGQVRIGVDAPKSIRTSTRPAG